MWRSVKRVLCCKLHLNFPLSRSGDAGGVEERQVCWGFAIPIENLHFFNPALVMECVEVVRNPETSDATVETVVALARRIGKAPVVLEREISGFVANRILGALTDEAVSLYESGIASFEDIDTACKKALGHPIGPFALMDLTGIDVNYYVRTARYEETGDESHKPKKSVAERFERGEYGRKSGKGWYEYR